MLFRVPNMSCGHCVSTITKAAQEVDADALVKADTDLRQVNIVTKADQDAMRRALEKAGYPAEPSI
ncbi:heavy-metal-associated domain-containing protein [Pseudooctadecabacter sp.]|uniref:heavy-metal-associated domain-containing protein n=1 Tax=Pseudooctadecabacter sp. TaxID=1966338 RepID=UPI0035C84A11